MICYDIEGGYSEWKILWQLCCEDNNMKYNNIVESGDIMKRIKRMKRRLGLEGQGNLYQSLFDSWLILDLFLMPLYAYVNGASPM